MIEGILDVVLYMEMMLLHYVIFLYSCSNGWNKGDGKSISRGNTIFLEKKSKNIWIKKNSFFRYTRKDLIEVDNVLHSDML